MWMCVCLSSCTSLRHCGAGIRRPWPGSRRPVRPSPSTWRHHLMLFFGPHADVTGAQSCTRPPTLHGALSFHGPCSSACAVMVGGAPAVFEAWAGVFVLVALLRHLYLAATWEARATGIGSRFMREACDHATPFCSERRRIPALAQAAPWQRPKLIAGCCITAPGSCAERPPVVSPAHCPAGSRHGRQRPAQALVATARTW